jgi:sec-independent protein translocase protein TatB
MFDIGFWELAMVGLVALLVIGPKDLPRVARKAGLWVGRARRTLASVKDEIDREFRAQELQEILNKQALDNPLERILDEPVLGSRSEPVQTQVEAPAPPVPPQRPAGHDATL